MGLASALSTALTGLTAAETQIDVVGNNLANSQTIGFKESEVAFTTQFLQTLSLGSQPTANTGGTNPRQTGLGTQVASITPVFTQGTIQTSSSPSDVALQGDGFFIVQSSSGEPLYTRSGIFKTNSQNELVTINGNRLLGYTVDDEFQLQTTDLVPLTVPVGSVRVAQATQNVFLEGTFTPTGDVADTAEVIESAILGDGSIAQPDSSSVSAIASPPPDESVITATPSAGGGLAAGVYRYRFVFVDDSGREGTVSAELAPPVTLAPGQGTTTLDNFPTDPNGEYTHLRIYRTQVDGSNFFRLGSTDIDLSAPAPVIDNGTVVLDTTQPLDQTVITGNYSYLITFANAQTETRPSPLIGTVNVTNGRIMLANLPTIPPPVAGGPVFDRIRVYRNLATDSSTYYFVDELTAGGVDYSDKTTDAALLAANQQIDLDGPKITPNTFLLDVLRRDDLNFENIFSEGTLTFSGRKGGRSLETQTFQVTTSSTVDDLMEFIRDSTGIQRPADDPIDPIPNSVNNIPGETSSLTPGAQITQDGRIRVVSNNGLDNAVTIGLSAFVLTETDGTVGTPNLGFGSVQDGAGQSAVTDFLVFDSLGVPVNVRITAVMQSRDGQATTYRWFADSPDNDPLTGIDLSVGTGLVTFDGKGNFISASNDVVSIDRRNTPAASPLDFSLDFSAINGLAAATASLAASRQDGSSAGTLSSFTIGEDGVIRGSFSNGVSRTLGQMRLVRFVNPAGMEQRGQDLFAEGANSGLPVEGNPGENGIGTLVAGAVELSNSDIGQNLIDLVLATTQYRGNTRVITTAQQLLDELLNLRR